ncbi:hypothetical protein B0F90DRAFT_66225 [Multifurca ochricompacta]|uniref:Uncharacterized protein n=1 Tax=Multifurca ochricompacta TaxID=376703 RepID=A0AAD4MD28_9AGAM|nr:hypothetical protein B0F90DRAFT_66225 [Multifurca ochricompacta]
MDPLSFQAVNPFATFYPPQSAEYDVYALPAQSYGDIDMMTLYSSSGDHCQADVVTNSLYSSETGPSSALPFLHGVWPSGNVASAPPFHNAVPQQPSQPEYPQTPSVLLHSPVPVSGASWPIISRGLRDCRDPLDQETSQESKHLVINNEPDLLQVYANVPRETFPTPSELLNKATSKQKPVNVATKLGRKTEKKVETQRKALQRVLEESIGFLPTDPDTISSHDKKRYYLECLEQYITYLHEQLRLVGHEPVALERVSTYRGLTSRSIRTMLVNTQNVLRKTHEETISEEKKFLELRDQVLSLDFEGRRHLCTETKPPI